MPMMDGIMVSPVGRPMSMTMCGLWLSGVGGNLSIAARINQIDWPGRARISGVKPSNSTSSESVSTKYSLKKCCK